MPDVNDIPSKALQVARKASPAAKNPKGMAAAGTALIALPYAAQGIAKLKGSGAEKAAEVGEKAKKKAVEKATPKGLSGLTDLFGGGKDDDDDSEDGGPLSKLSGLFGGDSDDDSSEEEIAAHGSGRRMPIQQAVDVAVPIKVAYNLWTQFEEWPTFMHRVESVQQVDDSTVEITTKAWGVTRQFEASIIEQRPDERIEWDVEEGLSHSGVVTFHELADRLTRIEISLDVEPEGLIEKAGRGMRFAKRAVRGDLHRFKAYAEIEEEAEEGGWRGTIEDGDVKSKTERKSGGSRSRSKSRASGQSKNGSDPSGSSRRSGSHN
jgi:uncharacterized membrane protein